MLAPLSHRGTKPLSHRAQPTARVGGLPPLTPPDGAFYPGRLELRTHSCSSFDVLPSGPIWGKGPSFLNVWEETPSTSCRMGSNRRKVVWILCSLLLLLEATSAKNIWKRALHLRLPKKSHAQEEEGPGQSEDSCPPPPRSLPPGACQVARCRADFECSSDQRCCYNGCAYTCLELVPPPPVVDWLVEPKPLWLGGNGWLLDGPKEVSQVEPCSTTADGVEPLLCPTGYECHIVLPGDMAKGIPNHGHCVKQRQKAEKSFLNHRDKKEYPEGNYKLVAEHGKGPQKHFQ
ncbi:WAP four-disulfide core domain protein 1 isoform X2 [Artibeus jamaicensis]|uniref:WAP four-disulfide core domain protein 1 isoform X2 n=1 Tax=Artibeus jamaicensis TaxID=9417 RepID=UPI00235AE540|nr:WAP four-disulfide core domain protein 1 isoform X2 [Artibeus jamaicensis]